MRWHAGRLRGLCGYDVRHAHLIQRTHLVSVRFEPTYSMRHAGCVLDLCFADERHVEIVAGVLAPFPMVLLAESTPLLWPKNVAEVISADRLGIIETDLLLWLRAMTSGRRPVAERLRLYTDGPIGELVTAARAHGWLGAAPYRDVALGAAPGAYAASRYAEKSVQVSDHPAGATGAWMLSQENQVTADLGSSEINESANRWFDTTIFGTLPEEKPQIALGFRDALTASECLVAENGGDVSESMVEPMPIDLMLSFDPDDGPLARSFSVLVFAQPQLRRQISVATPQALGGSSGRIAFLLRPDWRSDPDADSESAFVLAQWLRGEGLTVTLCDDASITDLSSFDLLHVHGLHHPQRLHLITRAARAKGLPVVLSAQLHEAVADPLWAISNASALYVNSMDGATEARYRDFLALKRLAISGSKLPGEPRDARDEAAMKAMLQDADEILVATGGEASRLGQRFGIHERVTICADALATDAPVADIGAIVGSSDFVLCDASITERQNILHLVRAAREARVRLVLSGPVHSAAVQAMLSEYIDQHVLLAPHRTDAQRIALYRRARVYVEPGFLPYGLSRIALALVSGCVPVVPKASDALLEFGAGMIGMDPLSVSEMAAGLRSAWDRFDSAEHRASARRAAAWANPLVLRTTVAQAYARAAARQASVSS